jgi:hypothetical protein
MRVIDRIAVQKHPRKSSLLGSLEGALKNLAGTGDEPAKTTLIAALERTLDNQYLMLGPVQLEGIEEPAPMVLLGPNGVWVMDASALKGIYQAKEDTWERLESQSHQFKPARPNLLTRILAAAQVVQSHLNTNGFAIQPVEPVLYFSDPGMHVNAIRPVVRIVLSDAVDRFVASIQQGSPDLAIETVQRVANLLSGEVQQLPEEKPVQPDKDIFSLRDLPVEHMDGPVRKVVVQKKRAPGKMIFNTRQWVFLGALVLVNLTILAAFVVFILYTN